MVVLHTEMVISALALSSKSGCIYAELLVDRQQPDFISLFVLPKGRILALVFGGHFGVCCYITPVITY